MLISLDAHVFYSLAQPHSRHSVYIVTQIQLLTGAATVLLTFFVCEPVLLIEDTRILHGVELNVCVLKDVIMVATMQSGSLFSLSHRRMLVNQGHANDFEVH